jgi:SAM-dependent MidA family methyltransferase
MLVIDYAVARTDELAERPWREWLRTYSGHERGAHYLRNIGQQDITADVCIDQIESLVGAADAVRSQSQFLQRWGIDELVAEGRRIWEAEAARPGLLAMKMRSRISEAEALLDPKGLGAFTVLEWSHPPR